MARTVLIDEFHVAVYIPIGLSATECRKVRRALQNRRFMPALQRAVREFFLRYPSLVAASVDVCR